MADRDDDLSGWDELRPPAGDDEDSLRFPPFAWTGETVNAQDHVRALFRQPLVGERSPPPPAPTLRSAAAELFRAAGLFGEAPAADDSSIAAAPADAMGPPSWKRPSRGTPPALLGDDSSTGPLRGAGPNFAPAPSANITASSATPREITAPGAPAPLDHPDARAGLALTAADTLLTKGIDLAANLAGGDPAVARKLVEVAANALAGALPQEFRASALTSAGTAAAEAERRVGENDRATRTRAALATLANRRAEAEQEHTAAVITGDHAKIDAARRDALDAWRAERRARGDGEAEINAAARALERDYRKTALRHRLAQLDGAGIDRAFDEDEDAKRDPALAREVADDIHRFRRDDPARVAEASIEREIAARKRDGRIDTPDEEAAARYKLRLDAQARRGIPEHQRRLLTNDERTALAAEYLRIEATSGKDAADLWLSSLVRIAGPYAAKLERELDSPSSTDAAPRDTNRAVENPGGDQAIETIEPAQYKPNRDPQLDASREWRVLERYRAFRAANPKATRAERDAAIESIAVEEGFLPRAVAQEFARRLRSPREEKDIGGFIADARRLARLALAFPNDIGPEGIPAGTLLVAGKIVEAAEANPELAITHPRSVVLSGIREAGEDAFATASELDLAVGIAVGLTIEPTRRHGFGALAAGLPLGIKRVARISRRGGTIPQDIDREGTARFLRQLNHTLRGSGHKVEVQQYEASLKEFGYRRIMDVHVVDTKTGKPIVVRRYEIKTEGARKTQNQIESDDILRWLGFAVHDVRVSLIDGRIKIDGQDAYKHFRELRRSFRRP